MEAQCQHLSIACIQRQQHRSYLARIFAILKLLQRARTILHNLERPLILAALAHLV
jgi:hypothetical protein